MKTRTGLLAVIVMLIASAVVVGQAEPVKAAPKKPLVQIAILLDTSGSMRGLIAQAKTQLWQIVNEFITMKRDGMSPEIHVALYQYGHSANPPLRQVQPLTRDLDKISQELFALTAGGSREYCGQIIGMAVDELKWSEDADALKVIFIAGNETFTQGPVDFRKTCKAAITKGIIVNTIHCGTEAAGLSGKWNEGAALADGQYMCINQDRAVVSITAPQDKELAALSVRLNGTYIPYGTRGKAGAANQDKQDANSAALSRATEAQRAITKGSSNYSNAGWDLVDAVRENTVKLEEVKEEDLPENMRKMDAKARAEYVTAQGKKRADVQATIKDLAAARKTYVAAEMKKRADKGEDTVGARMKRVLREQAAAKNIKAE